MDRLGNANALLINPVFREVMKILWTDLESTELNCDTTDLNQCQRLIVTKQQLALLERNIHDIISNEKAKIQLERDKDKPLDPSIEWGQR